jgi:protein SCO1
MRSARVRVLTLARVGARRPLLGLTTAVAALLLALGCGSGSGSKPPKDAAASGPSSSFSGGVANPAFPAGPLVLKDYRGKRVDLRGYRGKAVLVTFIYSHCPDVCPLIVGHLHTAQAELRAAARKLQIVAVSTDPRGDTPAHVANFLRQRRMNGKMDYLIGSRAELARVWKAWHIVAKPSKASPDKVEHSALIYGISASGKVTTLYPANFKPAWIVHDVPKLAAQ